MSRAFAQGREYEGKIYISKNSLCVAYPVRNTLLRTQPCTYGYGWLRRNSMKQVLKESKPERLKTKAKATDSRRKGKESQIGCENITCLKNPQIPRALGLGANPIMRHPCVAGFLQSRARLAHSQVLAHKTAIVPPNIATHFLVQAKQIHIGNRSVWFADSRLVFGP